MMRVGDTRIARTNVAFVLDFVDGAEGGADGRRDLLWYARMMMGDAILVGKENKVVVVDKNEEEDDNKKKEFWMEINDEGR
jgi:hypothetical protein